MIDEPELELEDDGLDEHLRRARPLPQAGWRGALRRELVAWPAPPPRPTGLWLRVAASAGLGAGLLAAALLAG